MMSKDNAIKQRKSITGALSYMQTNLKDYQKRMMSVDDAQSGSAWAVGGLIITMTANLMSMATDIIHESLNSGDADSKKDLIAIQKKFNEFMDTMIEHQDLAKQEQQEQQEQKNHE